MNMKTKYSTHLINRQRGFTLLEVLIAMVILAIGLFGLAGLQTASLRANTSAYQRSVASMLANDILDRMRGNILAAKSKSYDSTIGTPWTAANAPAAPKDGSNTAKCVTNSALQCEPGDLKDYDLNEWLTKDYKLKQLPDAQAVISSTDITVNSEVVGAQVTVELTWNDFSYSGTKGLGGQSSETFIYSTIIRF